MVKGGADLMSETMRTGVSQMKTFFLIALKALAYVFPFQIGADYT